MRKGILNNTKATVVIATLIAGYAQADTIGDAVKSGTAYGDFRLRYESVDQDNAVDDATALTLRTKLGYTTAAVSGFSATL